MGMFAAAADIIDPDSAPERLELRTPVTLAQHCDQRYQVRGHLLVIGEEIAALEAGDGDRLLLNTPPQVGKSTTAVEWGAFWWLCRHPTARIIIGSYGDSLAVKRGKAVRRLVELYGAKYGLILSKGSAAAKDWDVVTGGGVLSVGVGSGVTGKPGDVIFIDDPTKNRAEADSLVRRDAVYDWYSADLVSRQSPDTPIILIQTPWHPDDLRARVVKQEGDRKTGGRWRVVIMAAINEDPDDPMGRGIGEPLPHPKIDAGNKAKALKHWEKMRGAVSVRDWRSLWQCDPKAPEGVLLSWQMLRERRCYEQRADDACSTPVRVAVAIDPSGGGRDTAGVVGGFLGDDGRVHISHDVSGVMSPDAWARAACELAADTGADLFIVETNYGHEMAVLILRTAWNAMREADPARFGSLSPRIVEVKAKVGKLLRAEPASQQWVENRVVTSAYLPDVESEWATWTPGSFSPGRIDASVYLILELLPTPSSGAATVAGAITLSETDLFGGMFGGGRY